MFYRGIQTPRNSKSTRPTAQCFHLFLGVWIPRWNTRSRFGNSTSHHDSLPFFPTASHFTTFWLWFAQKSKFWDEKVQYIFRLFNFCIFFRLPFSPFLSFLLQWLAFYWACLRAIATCSGREFCSEFFTQRFTHISGAIRLITLIWVLLEWSFPPGAAEYRWCQFWSKVMTLEVEERSRLVTGGYHPNRSQRVNKTFRLSHRKSCKIIVCSLQTFWILSNSLQFGYKRLSYSWSVSFKKQALIRWFSVRTAQSQHPKVCESDWTECGSMLFVMQLIPYLWGILNCFLWFLLLGSCFV